MVELHLLFPSSVISKALSMIESITCGIVLLAMIGIALETKPAISGSAADAVSKVSS